jgi:hypothetical protein
MVTLDRVMENEVEIYTIPKQEVSSLNGRVVIIDGLAYKISCPRFKGCLGPTYNQGFIKYLCSDEHQKFCATENPNVCKHENFASIGHPAKHYNNNERNI